MKYEILINLLFVFIFYSIIGWLCEFLIIAISRKKCVNRGLSLLPMCMIYGISAVITTITYWNETNWLFIFCGSIIYGTAIQYLSAKILEYLGKRKWWDYSNEYLNFEGVVCLKYSIIWGILGVVITRIINKYIYLLLDMTPVNIISWIVLPILILLIIDSIVSIIIIKRMGKEDLWKTSISSKELIESVKNRLKNAYPDTKKKANPKLSFTTVVAIFIIAGVVGDLIEVVFCRFSMGKWMSRSGFAFGQFSMVWGFALAFGTVALYRYMNTKWWKIILIGSVFGGAFEYLCSMITEYFFDQIYWDYSHLPFNVNGRICLLFCVFWGIAFLVYLKVLLPQIMKLINAIPVQKLKVICWVIMILLVFDLVITNRIQQRYYQRQNNVEAKNIIEESFDNYFPDEWIINRWNNLKDIKNGKKVRIYEK